VPSPRFERLDQATRTAILEVARAEFAEHGFEGSSYNRIIANAGLSKSSFYYYFDGKEDLYATVVRDAVVQFAEGVGEARDVTTVEEFWIECTRLFRQFYEVGMKNPTLVGILRSVTELKPGALADQLRTSLTLRDTRWYEGIIQRGQAIGAVRTDHPLDLVVDIYFAVLVARVKWSMRRLLEGHLTDIEADIRDIIDLFRRMATPAPTGA
jgi:TetR/AcrR family transcriptional regulator, transcriptional repressor of aconitase